MILNIKLLKDGSGRVCIHYFVRDETGLIETPKGENRLKGLGGVKGRIACHPQQNTIVPQNQGMETLLCMNSDDVRAVTCPDCLATIEARAMLDHYAGSVDVAPQLALK